MISALIPRIFPAKKVHVKPYSPLPSQSVFNLFNKKFSEQANSAEFEILKGHLIEIDIADEIALLKQINHESILEISVPVFGVEDLLNSTTFSPNPQSFASVVKLEGFAQKSDFVLVTDIVGNQYEILVGPAGEIMLPNEGTGLFSIPSKITFMFSDNKKENSSSKLYLLPPAGMTTNFECHICVAHINEKMQRIVDSIRSIKVRYAPVPTVNKLLLLSLTETIYSKTDLIKDYFTANRFHFSQRSGFNQFLLHEEAFDVLYDKILYDLIHQRLSHNQEALASPSANFFQAYPPIEKSSPKIASSKLRPK